MGEGSVSMVINILSVILRGEVHLLMWASKRWEYRAGGLGNTWEQRGQTVGRCWQISW